MPDNKLSKRDLFWNIFSIFVAVIFIACMLCLSVLGIKVSLEQLDRKCVAYADSTDGVVEDNIFTVSTFEGLSGSTTSNMQLDTSGWYLSGAGSNTRSFLNSVLSSSVYALSGVYANMYTFLSNPFQYAGETFTFSCYGEIISYDFLLQVWYNDTNVSTTVLSTTGYNTTELKSLSFTVPSTITSQGIIRIIVQTRGSVKVDWVKLEQGSSFTGYVPKDYTNYGYNQGYTDGYDQGTIDGSIQQSIFNTGISSYMPVSSYSSLGGFSFQSAYVDNPQVIDIKRVSNVESYYKSAPSPISTWYNGLTVGLTYNIFYSDANPTITGGTPATPGLYGVKSSLASNFGEYTFIPKGSVFSFNLISCKYQDYDQQGSYGNKSLNIAFLDANGEVLRISDNTDLNGFFFDSFYLDSSLVSNGQALYLEGISPSSIHYFKLPYDVYGILIYASFDQYMYYVAYNAQLSYFPASDYNQGYLDGLNYGLQEGTTISYQQGYNAGWIAKTADQSDYSFKGLITSVIDVPVYTIFGLLDFNLLGVNMKSLFLALFTIMIVAVIVRLILGGI